jgi:hypothetical protein
MNYGYNFIDSIIDRLQERSNLAQVVQSFNNSNCKTKTLNFHQNTTK